MCEPTTDEDREPTPEDRDEAERKEQQAEKLRAARKGLLKLK